MHSVLCRVLKPNAIMHCRQRLPAPQKGPHGTNSASQSTPFAGPRSLHLCWLGCKCAISLGRTAHLVVWACVSSIGTPKECAAVPSTCYCHSTPTWVLSVLVVRAVVFAKSKAPCLLNTPSSVVGAGLRDSNTDISTHPRSLTDTDTHTHSTHTHSPTHTLTPLCRPHRVRPRNTRMDRENGDDYHPRPRLERLAAHA